MHVGEWVCFGKISNIQRDNELSNKCVNKKNAIIRYSIFQNQMLDVDNVNKIKKISEYSNQGID